MLVCVSSCVGQDRRFFVFTGEKATSAGKIGDFVETAFGTSIAHAIIRGLHLASGRA